MKKIALLIIILVLLSSCAQALDKSFSEEKLDETIYLVLDNLHLKDSQAIREMSIDLLAEGLTDATMETVYNLLEEAGPFKEIEKITRASMKDKDMDEIIAVCSIKVAYENRTYLYTMSFTQDYKLAGLFFK